MCTFCRGKQYILSGDDNQKLETLRNLANSDYLTVHDRNLPDNAVTVLPNKDIKGTIFYQCIHDFFKNNPDYFIDTIEQELPVLFLNNKNVPIKQKLPKSPLFVLTMITEDEEGFLMPFK